MTGVRLTADEANAIPGAAATEIRAAVRATGARLGALLTSFDAATHRLPDDRLRELDLLVLGIVRERDHFAFLATRAGNPDEVWNLVRAQVEMLETEYLPAVADHLAHDAHDEPARLSILTTLSEILVRLAVWIGPLDPDLSRALAEATGLAFDPLAAERREGYPAGKRPPDPGRRWRQEIGPRRDAIAAALQASGVAPADALVVVAPAPEAYPHWLWNLPLLVELTGVSDIQLGDADRREEDRVPSSSSSSFWRAPVQVLASPHAPCARCRRRVPPEGRAPGGRFCQRCARALAAAGASPPPSHTIPEVQ